MSFAIVTRERLGDTLNSPSKESNLPLSDYQFGCVLRWWLGETRHKSESSEQRVEYTTFWLLVRIFLTLRYDDEDDDDTNDDIDDGDDVVRLWR